MSIDRPKNDDLSPEWGLFQSTWWLVVAAVVVYLVLPE